MSRLKGSKLSEEHKRKISEAMKKNPTRYWLGKHRNKKTKEKLRIYALEQFKNGMPEETKKKISISNKGLKDSEETKKRKSIAVRKRIKSGDIYLFKKGNKMRLGVTSWNKNLTKETDERVANYAKKKEGVKRSKETCEKLSNSLKGKYIGKNANNWQGGKSFEPYGLEFNNSLKEKIRKRDNYKCKLCNIDESKLKQKLNIHHIDYNKQNNSKDNLISLCLSCHMKTNFERNYWEELFKTI